MTDVSIPHLQRRVEELALEDEVKQRPWEQHAAGTGKGTSLDKEPPIVDDVSPMLVDDVSPMVLQQNQVEGSGAEEDSDVEEYKAPEDIDPVLRAKILNSVEYRIGPTFGYCSSCVDNEVCKNCGHKNGRPADYNPVNCIFCGTTEHTDGSCMMPGILSVWEDIIRQEEDALNK